VLTDRLHGPWTWVVCAELKTSLIRNDHEDRQTDRQTDIDWYWRAALWSSLQSVRYNSRTNVDRRAQIDVWFIRTSSLGARSCLSSIQRLVCSHGQRRQRWVQKPTPHHDLLPMLLSVFDTAPLIRQRVDGSQRALLRLHRRREGYHGYRSDLITPEILW